MYSSKGKGVGYYKTENHEHFVSMEINKKLKDHVSLYILDSKAVHGTEQLFK